MTYENGYTWCPECQYWVPIKNFTSDWDPEEHKLYSICDNCLEPEHPTFERKSWNYDPVKCLYCDSRDVVKLEQKQGYKCKNCEEVFYNA